MKPTEQQLRVMNDPIGNLLVSAAAGSGKTTVLVERIMKMISSEDNPVDIDEILIVTFTRNAAAEMRNKIENAIEKALEENPNDERMQRQARNIHFAKISTIDSFCQAVVRRYCHMLDIDPGFRMAENSESEALLTEAIGEVLEKAYDSDSTAFRDLTERYGGRFGDRKLEDILRNLIKKCDSNPFPEEWLEEKLGFFTETQDPFTCAYAKDLFVDFKSRIGDMYGLLTAFLPRFAEPGMPTHMQRAMLADAEIIADLNRAESLRELAAYITSMPSWPRATKKKTDEGDDDKKELCDKIRTRYKNEIGAIAKTIGMLDNGILRMQEECGPSLSALCDLAKRVRARFTEKQNEIGAYDFSTMSHLALRILLDENRDPSQAAIQIRKEFAEIMIDEYQDSNMLQEYILNAVTRKFDGLPNLFMVGDVKQSIYRFRKARPELFIGKCDDFVTDSDEVRAAAKAGGEQPKGYRIDLQKNFRSRRQVVDSVNEIFRQVMHRNVGDVEYDSRAELVYGEAYDAYLWNDEDYRSELLIAADAGSGAAGEAEMIVSRIEQLTDPEKGLRIREKGNEEGRIAQYRDVVILTRSRSELYNEVIRSLQRHGIPACSASADGYYESFEVSLVVSLLRVIDNPFDEIPLAEVLMSPVIGFSADDLGRIAVAARKSVERRKSEYTQTVIRAVAEDPARYPKLASLHGRCSSWIELYDRLKRHAAYVSAAEIIEEFVRLTGLTEYCSALPDGEVRRRNLRILFAKAEQYHTTLSGNFRDFLTYLDNSITYDKGLNDDMGGQAGPNAVRLMTIHASKGLEFPIVFLADTMRQMNMLDFRGDLLIHDDLGFGPTVMYPKARLKTDSLAKKVIIRRGTRELVGEELRLLYVAMTRAEEKLIVTGHLPSADAIGDCLGSLFRYNRRICYADLVGNDPRYLPIILRAVMASCDEQEVEKFYNDGEIPEVYTANIGAWTLDIKPVKLDTENECVEDADAEMNVEEKGSGADTAADVDETLCTRYTEELRRYREYQYPYTAQSVPVKVSVSALKKQAYLEKEAEEDAREKAEGIVSMAPEHLLQPPKETEPVPSFAAVSDGKDDVSAATEFGTLCHRVLQLHDYTLPNTEEAFRGELALMCERRQIDEAEAGRLAPKRFLSFYESELGARMREAYIKGTLERERSFIMARPASEIYPDAHTEEPVLIQGEIDAFFEEDGGIVIVDYKTDRVDAENGEKELRKRYEKQLQLYADAVARGTGKKIREVIIYSFALNKCIGIEYNNAR
jgi:helicase-exonuclease AddAB, AddA subunit, Firmicutes type